MEHIHDDKKVEKETIQDDRGQSSWKKQAVDENGNKMKTFHTMLAICYLGTKFNGSQIQKPEFPTIEGEMYNAMKVVKMDAGREFKDMSVTRCSRTDAGVSAALTVFTLFLTDPATAAENLNRGLKELGLENDIRCLGSQRVMPKFNAQRFCISRYYEYYCPKNFFSYYPLNYFKTIIPSEYSLNSFLESKKEFRNFIETKIIKENEMRYISYFRVFFALETFHKYFVPGSEIPKEESESRSMFRKSFDENYIPNLTKNNMVDTLIDYICDPIKTYLVNIKKMDLEDRETPVPLEEFIEFFTDYANEVFCGLPARKFHNYTDIIKTNTLSGASRVIHFIKFFLNLESKNEQNNKNEDNNDCICSDLDKNFVAVRIHGQSFMLHQIRRMMGALTMVAHGYSMSCFIPGTLHANSYLDSTPAIKQAGNGYGYKERRRNNGKLDENQENNENDESKENEENEENTKNQCNKDNKKEEVKEKRDSIINEKKKIRYNVPTAPGCYLFLVKPDFGDFSKSPKNTPHGEFLPEQKEIEEKSKEFMKTVIRPAIVKEHETNRPDIPYEDVLVVDKCLKPVSTEDLKNYSFINATKYLMENLIENSKEMEKRIQSVTTVYKTEN